MRILEKFHAEGETSSAANVPVIAGSSFLLPKSSRVSHIARGKSSLMGKVHIVRPIIAQLAATNGMIAL